MTSDERAKLYEALDYKENQPPTTYPKEVKIFFRFVIRRFEIGLVF